MVHGVHVCSIGFWRPLKCSTYEAVGKRQRYSCTCAHAHTPPTTPTHKQCSGQWPGEYESLVRNAFDPMSTMYLAICSCAVGQHIGLFTESSAAGKRPSILESACARAFGTCRNSWRGGGDRHILASDLHVRPSFRYVHYLKSVLGFWGFRRGGGTDGKV